MKDEINNQHEPNYISDGELKAEGKNRFVSDLRSVTCNPAIVDNKGTGNEHDISSSPSKQEGKNSENSVACDVHENTPLAFDEPKRDINYWVKYWKSMQEKGCPNFDVYLQIYEDTSKAKNEEFIKILDELQDYVDALQMNYANLDECKKDEVIKIIEIIKEKLEGEK